MALGKFLHPGEFSPLIYSHRMNSHPENSYLIQFPPEEFPPGDFPPGDFPLFELHPRKIFAGRKMNRNYEIRKMISIYNCV